VRLLVLFGCASTAQAHLHQGEQLSFFSGFHHPISGLDHVVAMIAVGLWGAQLGAPAIWVLPVAFPMVMALGGVLGLLAVPLPGTEIGIALSALALGIAVLLAWRPPLAIAGALISFFAIFHGYAHGHELPAGENALLYSLGFVVATGCLHAIGIATGLINRDPWGQRSLRAGGAAIAATGVYFLYRALA
jgi:urease accessory protein